MSPIDDDDMDNLNFGGTSTMVGRYQVGRPLGFGSSSVVTLGRHTQTGQVVALKQLRKYDLLRRERAALTKLRHPNIIMLFDTVKAETGVYLVLECANGGNLKTLLSRAHGALPESQAQKYFRQLVRAVHHCHSKGVVHRDLKPENLLLDARGNLKVADFGLSAFPHQLKNGEFPGRCGTNYYMAPEVIARHNNNGVSADVWACGVILFLMLVGRRPFEFVENDDGNAHLFNNILTTNYVMPLEGISPGARDLIKRVLNPNPRTRIDCSQILEHEWVKGRLVADNPAGQPAIDKRVMGGFLEPVDFLKVAALGVSR